MPKKVYGPLDAYKQVSMYMHLTGIHNATIAVECQDEKLSCVTEQMRENIKRECDRIQLLLGAYHES